MMISDKQKRSDIMELQGYIRTIARADERIPSVKQDGVFGNETIEAVKAFQREYDLPVTGEVDSDTWNKIYRTFRNIQQYFLILAEIAPFTNRELILKRGDSGFLIYIVQAMLNTIGQFYSNLTAPAVTGTYDEDTEKAVRQVQQIAGMNPDGQLDNVTWNHLAKLYNAHATMEQRSDVTTNGKPEVMSMRSVG